MAQKKEIDLPAWVYRGIILLGCSIYGYYYNKSYEGEIREKQQERIDKKEITDKLNSISNGQVVVLSRLDGIDAQVYSLNQKQDLDNENLQGIHLELSKKVRAYYYDFKYESINSVHDSLTQAHNDN